MSGLVVDASVAIKWVIDETDSAAASRLVGTAPLMAPDLIGAELANVLWRHVGANRLGDDCSYLALADRLDCPMVTADRRFHARVAASEWRHRIRAL